MGQPLDERQLVERILQGDEKAKTELFMAYRQKLYSFCVYILGAPDPEIEDILQEAFLAGFQNLSRFEFRSSLDTWLTQICIHKCYRHLRKRSRMVAQEDSELENLLSPLAMERSERAAQAGEQKEKLEIVRRALEKMGGPCREILEMRNKKEASYIEMARMLKVPVGTVMSRLARCTAALKEEVKRLLKEGSK
jgi:RNA polymerase sigma-70 factor (ECF subfamily)